jgi:hypothetical protein
MRSGSLCCMGLLLIGGSAAIATDAEPLAPLQAALDDACVLEADARRDETPACWRLRCAAAAPRELGCDVTALHQIVSIQASPDQRHLAVMTVGEGHPILEIVALQALVAQGEYAVRCTFNPYPGTIWVSGWQPGGLHIGSDVDLQLEAQEQRADSMFDRSYSLSPDDCALTVLETESAARE